MLACCHSYNISINIIIFIIKIPAFLSCHDTVILTNLLPLRQLLPILLQFYFTLTIGIPHILSSIIFSFHSNIFLQYSHLLLMTATFFLYIPTLDISSNQIFVNIQLSTRHLHRHLNSCLELNSTSSF